MRHSHSLSSATGNQTPVQKGCSTVFFSIFLVMGLAFTGAVLFGAWQTAKTYLWKETPCTIIESRGTDPSIDHSTSSRVIVRYRYAVGGQEQASSRRVLGMHASEDAAEARRIIAKYPPGAWATCYVDPHDPAEATLERGSLWIGLVVFFPLIFVAIGLFGIIRTWRPQSFNPRPLSRGGNSQQMGTLGQTVVFGIFGLVGAVGFYFLGFRPLWTYQQAKNWPEVPCQIVSSSVGSHSGKHGSTYSVDIVYRYRIEGQEYESDRYNIFGGSSSGYSGKAAIVAKYPPGSRALCFVNPDERSEALLNRDPSAFWLIGLLPLVFLLVGVGGLLGKLRTIGSHNGSQRFSAMPQLPTTPTLPTGSGMPGGSTLLKPSASPIAKLIGAICIALFWNGIVSVFLYQVVKSWRVGSPEYFLTLFMIPFVLVGIALLGAVAYTFLNLFNPRVALNVNSTSIPLGGTLDVQWAFRGNVNRISKFKLVLEGKESATYRRGTTTSTDHSTFARIVLFETEHPQAMAQGRASVTIPAHLMHTWIGTHNKVTYELQARGEIPRFPDVSEDFGFVVLPRSH